MAPDTLAARPPAKSAQSPAEPGAGPRERALAARPWVWGLALATPLSAAYLLARPPAGDLAAASYRGDVLARAGFALWDNGWYGGHYLPGYSVLAPALGALAGERLLLALCTLAAVALFGVLAQRAFPPGGARAATLTFALGACVTMLSGRVAFTLGLAVGLLALVAFTGGRTRAAVALALLTTLASPVAGAFLALCGVADALAVLAGAVPGTLSADDRRRRPPARIGRRAAPGSPPHPTPRRWRAGLALAAGALAPIAAFALAFPEGGYEPFAGSVFWPGLAGVVAIAALLPRIGGDVQPRAARALAAGAWLYALALVGAFALRTPVGSNAARLGALLAAPLAAGALWRHRRAALLALAPALLYWQLETPIADLASLAGDPSVNASYYAPLAAELQRRAHGAPLRVEVPLTGAHWEAAHLAGHGTILLARGWERQLDTRYGSLFYEGGALARPSADSPGDGGAQPAGPGGGGAAAYRAWLYDNAVAYVALPDVRLDFAGAAEGRLIERGEPYLRMVWRAAHWRLYEVLGARPLASAPGALTAVGTDTFALTAPAPGRYVVRLRYTPYWAVRRGQGCVGSAPGGWTAVEARAPGRIAVGIDFSVARVFDHGARCT